MYYNSFFTVIDTIRSDSYRYAGKFDILRCYRKYPSFRFIVWFRLTNYFWLNNRKIAHVFSFIFYAFHKYKLGIDIPYNARIAPGLYIGHFSGIIVSADALIGKNCNISQGVTIGAIANGKRSGAPVIKDNVYIGPNAVITGGITIGSGAVIGPNSHVNFDVSAGNVVLSTSKVILSEKGSIDYCVNKI